MKRLAVILLSMAAAMLTGSCYDAIHRQLQYGDYESSLRESLTKIEKSRKRDQYIDLALAAYNKAVEEDKLEISRLKAGNDDGRHWGRIFHIYSRMDNRQRVLRPYLPLTYLNGNTVNVPLHDLGPVLEEARRGAAGYHYGQAVALLEAPDRLSARRAVEELEELARYMHPYKDAESLYTRAVDEGTNRVLLTIRPASGVHVPDEFLRELAQFDFEGALGPWTELHREPQESVEYDYGIDIRLERIDMSPQQWGENHYTVRRDVQDGHRPLVDQHGHYVTDSTGQIIQVPHYTTLVCHVTEWTQRRQAAVFTAMDILDARTQRLVTRQPLEDHVVFTNDYARANGHLDILSPEQRARIQRMPLPFPTDGDMLQLSVPGLQRQIREALVRHRHTLQNA